MNKKFMVVAAGLMAVSVQAALVWTGTAGNSMFNEGSWLDHTNAIPAAGTIDGNVAVAAYTGPEKLIEIATGTGSPNNWWSNLHVGNNSLTVSNKLVKADAGRIALGEGQIKGAWEGAGQVLKVLDGATLQVGDARNFGMVIVDNATLTLTRYITTSTATGADLTITNGGTLSASYMTGYANATVDATSSVTLTAASNPLRNNIHLAEGAELTLVNAAMFITEGAQIFVDGVSYASNPSILTITGNTATAGTYAGPRYGSPFQDGMVLQRGKPVKVWGTATPTNLVTVSINGTNAAAMSDLVGNWQVELSAMSAGGPYELQAVSNGETNTLTDVLVGDVWIAFGQSNMVRPLKEMTNKQTYIDDISTNRMIRCLKVAQDAALTPQESGSMTWLDNSNPGSWSSVAAVFAHQMHEGSGVPTAVVWAGWGSSSIEGWMPIQMTNDFPHFEAKMQDFYANDEATVEEMINGTQAWDDVYIRTRPNIIYNQRIHPLLNFGISGFVWYQGEANAGSAENVAQYGFTLPAFVTEYRELFAQGDLPFLGVQLPSYNSTYWAWFRESQSRITSLSNAHVAVTIDTGLSGNIHPYDKEPIGQRLALLGRKYALGEDIVAHGPTFESMSIDGANVTISFNHAVGLTTDDAAAPSAFELAGLDKVWYDATSSSISGTHVIVSSTSVTAPVAVRYAWLPYAKDSINLINSDGLPAAPFRTDDWAVPNLGSQAPMAVKDSFSVFTNETLMVPTLGILENDIDLNRDVLTASLVSDVTYGTLSLASDGSFSYTADAGFAGEDYFEYAASDGALSATTTVSILVNRTTAPGSELIFNGDFETNDGATGGNTFAGFNSWVGYNDGGSPDIRNDSGNGNDVVATSIMPRLASTSTTGGDRGIYQDFRAGSWDNSDTFAISLNATEVSWKAGGSNNDGITIALGDQDGGNAVSSYLNLDGSYDASNKPYVTWAGNQTHELTITGAELIAAGVTAGENLRLDISSTYTGSGNSIVWIDNVSVIVPVVTVGDISFELISGNTQVEFSWLSQVGATYVLEMTEDLTTNGWQVVTNFPGTGDPVSITEEMDKASAFYRVYLVE